MISLDIWNFSAPKQHRPDFGKVSYYFAMGEQQGGYRNRMRKSFSRSHHAAFSKERRLDLGRFKEYLAISPIPAVYYGPLNALD